MRIYSSENIPFDFCLNCAPTEEEAIEEFGGGSGPDNRGDCFAYNAEHPDYEEAGEEYSCEYCGTILGEYD